MQSLWMIVASLLFACMGVCVKLGSARFTTGELVFYRGLVGFVMMFGLLRLQGLSCATPHWRLQLSRACRDHRPDVLLLPSASCPGHSGDTQLHLATVCRLAPRLLVPGACRKHLFAAVALGFIGVVLLLQPTLDPRNGLEHSADWALA
jgi:drug/metabolite transporter (DMT)-like permease